MNDETIPDQQISLPTPHSILEAGGEAVGTLLVAIAESIAELAPHQVLEVVSSEPLAADAITAWCKEMGHDLLHRVLEDERGCFSIRKLDATNPI